MRLIYTTLKFRRANWPDKTYRASHGNRTFTVDLNGAKWSLRSWFAGVMDTYERGDSASELMAMADDIATNGK